MSYTIVILGSAEQDMKELRSYIVKNFSLATWQDTYSKLKDTLRNLKAFPFAGSIPEELERLNLTQYRQVISGMNRVIYEVRQKIIYVHIVADTRKEMKTLLTQRLLRSA